MLLKYNTIKCIFFCDKGLFYKGKGKKSFLILYAALFGNPPYKILLFHHPHKNSSPHITFCTHSKPFKPTKINAFPLFYVSHSLQRPGSLPHSHRPFNPYFLIGHYNKKGDTPRLVLFGVF